MKRKLASVLLSLLLGWSATLAIAEDDKTGTAPDSSIATSVPDGSTDTATVGSTPDEAMSAKPEEDQK